MQHTLPLGLAPVLPPIRNRLLAVYGPQRDAFRHDPNQQLLKAMLSTRTYDAVSETTYRSVSAQLPSLDALAHMNPATLTGAISNVTYAADKAAYLVEAARYICSCRGRLDLTFLADWPVEDALLWLQRIRGIGPKTAAVILNFSTLRMRTFAIDTHVLRVLKRLELVRPKATFRHAHRVVMRLVPDDWNAADLYELHWLIKQHGQERCRHERPDCQGCPLANVCAYPKASKMVASDLDR
jgi:endonuclease-3